MNKKFLSVAAASVLAAGLIGCGGGSGSSSSSTTTSSSSSVKGVDGYVMNAAITVNYWDKDTNKTKPYTLDVKKDYFSKDKVTKKGIKGKATYSLASLNPTILNNIVSVEMSHENPGFLANGNSYPQSFFDADGNREFNSSIDVIIPAGVTLKAPRGYSVITPISTIIADQVTAKLTADKNETNLTNVVDAYTKDIANALGVDANTLKNVDPISLRNSTDEISQAYVVANAFAGALIRDNVPTQKLFASLKAATPATSATEVISNLAKAAKAAGDTTVTTILNQVVNKIKTDKKNLIKLVKSNLDRTRTISMSKDKLTIIDLSGKNRDLNITKMTTYAGGNGYKIATSALNELNITLAAPKDKNITHQKFTFVIRVADPKKYQTQETNQSTLTVKVPFEVNSTNGEINASIPSDVKIFYEGTNTDGSRVIKGDTNSTIFGNGNDKGGEILSVTGNTITIKAKKLIDDIDANETGAFFGNGLPADIVQLQAGIVVNNNNTGEVEGKNYVIPTQDTIISAGQNIIETVDSMISFNIEKNLVADIRGGVTRANADGNASVSYVTHSGNTVGTNQNSSHNSLLEVDFNKTKDSNVTLKFKDSSIDKAFEANATVGNIELNDTLNKALSINHSSLSDLNTTADGKNELNVTVDYSTISKLTTAGHPQAMLTFKATDEFGATGKEENMTLWFNRAPKLTTNTIYAKLTADGNITGVYSDSGLTKEINVSGNMGKVDVNLSKFMTDLDGYEVSDVNITAVTNTDINSSTYAGGTYSITSDVNTTAAKDTNISINGAPSSTSKLLKNSYLELNVTDRAWKKDNNDSIILKLNMKDKYGASKEENLTIQFKK